MGDTAAANESGAEPPHSKDVRHRYPEAHPSGSSFVEQASVGCEPHGDGEVRVTTCTFAPARVLPSAATEVLVTIYPREGQLADQPSTRGGKPLLVDIHAVKEGGRVSLSS